MAEMKNICGKIPMDLHEKVREEIELTESSTQRSNCQCYRGNWQIVTKGRLRT